MGIQFILGALVSLGALGGTLLLLNFVFATAHQDPASVAAYAGLAGAMILMGCFGAGLTWGADAWLVARFHPAVILFPLRRSLPD